MTESLFHLTFFMFFFCSLLASLVCVYPISLICQHSVSLNVGSRSFHVNIMKAAAVHHLLPSQQQQANTSVSKNENYSGTIPLSRTMVEPEPPKTREAGGEVSSGQVLMCANTVRYIDTGIELKCSTSHFKELPVMFSLLSLVCLVVFVCFFRVGSSLQPRGCRSWFGCARCVVTLVHQSFFSGTEDLAHGLSNQKDTAGTEPIFHRHFTDCMDCTVFI